MPIKNLFNRIFGITNVKELQQQQLQQEQRIAELLPETIEGTEAVENIPPVASLHITLLNNGNLQLAADWSEQTEAMGKLYGKFLYYILSGNVEDSILQHLAIYSQHDITKQNFVESIVTSLQKYKTDNQEEPVISPSNALKIDTLKRNDDV